MANFALSVTSSIVVRAASSGRRAQTFVVSTTGERFQIYAYEAHGYRRTLADTDGGMSFSRQFIIIGTSDPTQCIDIGPKRGDFFANDTRFVVAERSIEELGKDHTRGEHQACLLTVTYRTATADQAVIETADQNISPGGGGGGGEKEKNPDPFQTRLQISIGGESIHITQAIEQQSFKDGPIANFGTTIGVTDDGAEGVDINAPIMSFSETHYIKAKAFNVAYIKTLTDHLFTVNKQAFRGFNAGDALFSSVNARPIGGLFEVVFEFQVRPTEDWEIELIADSGGDPTFNAERGTKKGWEYLWTREVEILREDGLGNGVKWRAPYSVHQAQVYRETDFSALNIGTEPWEAVPGLADAVTVDDDAPTPGTLSQGLGFG